MNQIQYPEIPWTQSKKAHLLEIMKNHLSGEAILPRPTTTQKIIGTLLMMLLLCVQQAPGLVGETPEEATLRYGVEPLTTKNGEYQTLLFEKADAHIQAIAHLGRIVCIGYAHKNPKEKLSNDTLIAIVETYGEAAFVWQPEPDTELEKQGQRMMINPRLHLVAIVDPQNGKLIVCTDQFYTKNKKIPSVAHK